MRQKIHPDQLQDLVRMDFLFSSDGWITRGATRVFSAAGEGATVSADGVSLLLRAVPVSVFPDVPVF